MANVKSYRKTSQVGFSVIELLILIVVAGGIVFVGWRVFSDDPASTTPITSTNVANTNIDWRFIDDSWQPSANPPECADPIQINSPVDESLATSILYPGQDRAGAYRVHGGFRFDNSANGKIEVKAPMDARLISVGRYTNYTPEEVQHLLYFTTDCGIAFRLDHLVDLTPKFQKLADELPAAKPNDSRTTNLNPAIKVEKGELLATSVGFPSQPNVFIDFGVSDLRAPNINSKDESWAKVHQDNAQHDFYGICWFDLLPAKTATFIRSLPGSGQEAKTSDYC